MNEKVEHISELDVWETTDQIITDEGGVTHKYIHTLKLNGKTYVFIERNVFDFGRVINSGYAIAPSCEGGIPYKKMDPCGG